LSATHSLNQKQQTVALKRQISRGSDVVSGNGRVASDAGKSNGLSK
jgi:hypothetical protein